MDGTASVVAREANSTLDVFARGPLNHLYYKSFHRNVDFSGGHIHPTPHLWDPSVDGWYDLGGDVWGTPSAVSWGPNRLDVVVGSINPDGKTYGIFHKAWDGKQWLPSQTGWETVGGPASTVPPVAVSWGPNRLDIFAIASSPANSMLHVVWDGSKWTARNLGGSFLPIPPAVCSRGPNLLDIVAIGSDQALYRKAWDGSKWLPSELGWENLGGRCNAAFRPRIETDFVATGASAELFVFAVGVTPPALFWKYWSSNEGWWPGPSDWASLGGNHTAPPAVVNDRTGKLHVYAKGTEDAIWQKSFHPGERGDAKVAAQWGQWQSLGGKAWVSRPRCYSPL